MLHKELRDQRLPETSKFTPQINTQSENT